MGVARFCAFSLTVKEMQAAVADDLPLPVLAGLGSTRPNLSPPAMPILSHLVLTLLDLALPNYACRSTLHLAAPPSPDLACHAIPDQS